MTGSAVGAKDVSNTISIVGGTGSMTITDHVAEKVDIGITGEVGSGARDDAIYIGGFSVTFYVDGNFYIKPHTTTPVAGNGHSVQVIVLDRNGNKVDLPTGTQATIALSGSATVNGQSSSVVTFSGSDQAQVLIQDFVAETVSISIIDSGNTGFSTAYVDTVTFKPGRRTISRHLFYLFSQLIFFVYAVTVYVTIELTL